MPRNITLRIEFDYESMSLFAADIFAKAIRAKPDGVFGFATGGTPVGLYQALVRMHQGGTLDFSRVTTFNLDEYHPIARSNTQSYYHFMFDKLFGHVNVNPANVHLPNGEAEDVASECRSYDKRISDAGGIDCQILGIGANGHIGFNEPGESFVADTQYVALNHLTVQSNARFFNSEDEVPRHAITMGIREIMLSRQILMVCSGEDKAAILRDALTGPVTPLVPASILQLHPNVTVVVDKAAAGSLPL